MKQIVLIGGLVLLLAALPAGAQLTSLSESFVDITTLPGNGWFLQNNSQPPGVTNWFQGNPNVFPAHSGNPPEYIAANFNNTAGTGTISNWLLTPEMYVLDGAALAVVLLTTPLVSWSGVHAASRLFWVEAVVVALVVYEFACELLRRELAVPRSAIDPWVLGYLLWGLASAAWSDPVGPALNAAHALVTSVLLFYLVITSGRPEVQPMYDPFSHLAYVLRSTDVETVVIDGRVVLRDRRPVGLDVAELLERVGKQRERVARSLVRRGWASPACCPKPNRKR